MTPFKIELRYITVETMHHTRFGRDCGTTKRYVYMCPCGCGYVIELMDYGPGYDDDFIYIDCEFCKRRYKPSDFNISEHGGIFLHRKKYKDEEED